MATPFSAFRKYTGAAMAVLCGLLMVSFVIADPLTQMLGGGGGLPSTAKDTVAVWSGGKLNELEIGQAVRHRLILAEFQQEVFTLGLRDAQAAGVGDLPLRVRPLALPSKPSEGVERDVVQIKILAQRARDAGMVVSDEMIVDYLKALGRDRVSNEQMRTILGAMRVGGRRTTIEFIFELLREAILAKNLLASHQYAFGSVLPEERWEDWLKVNDRVILEAAPVAVADFVDQVEEPGESEIAEFFDAYRDREPRPDALREYGGVILPSPLPAFTTPPRARLQYVVAKFEDFAAKAEPEITDDEIAAYYDENKDRFIAADRALFGDDDLFGEPTVVEDDPVAPPTEDASDAAAEEDPADDASAIDNATEPADPPEADAEPAPESQPAEPAGESAAASDETPPADEPATTDAADEAGAVDDLGADVLEEEEEEQVADEAAAETAAEADAEAEAEAEPKAEVTYQPLDEVRDEIRRRLAENRAALAMRDLMFALKTDLDDAFAVHFDARLDAADAGEEPPAPPKRLTDLTVIAGENELEQSEVGPISRLDLVETPYGSSISAEPTAAQPLPLWYLTFREGEIETLEPFVTFDGDGNMYLSVIQERLDRTTPELNDARDEAVAAWKKDKAADVALAAAEELAAAIGESDFSIEGYLEANPGAVASEAFETDPMGFLTVGSVSQQTGEVTLQLSQPEPLVAPGPELLKTVFALGEGEVGAALNHDRTIAYVLRVATRLTPPLELRQQFLNEGGVWYGSLPMARTRHSRARAAVIGEVLDAAELEWLREPDQSR